jgi:hypothetical protein
MAHADPYLGRASRPQRDRREFLKRLGRTAALVGLGGLGKACAPGTNAGQPSPVAPAPTLSTLSVSVQKTFGSGPLAPFDWTVGNRSGSSADGTFLVSGLAKGDYPVTISGQALKLTRQTTLAVTDNTNAVIDAIPADYPFNIAHNNEIAWNGFRLEYGMSPRVLAVKTSEVSSTSLDATRNAVAIVNSILAGLLTATFDVTDLRPTPTPRGTIVALFGTIPGVIETFQGNAPGSFGGGAFGVPHYFSQFGILHELLHVLGFGHTSAPNSIMQPYPSQYGLPDYQYPTHDDQDSMRWKYMRKYRATTANGGDSD